MCDSIIMSTFKVNFIILLVGLAFTFAENYIDGDVIECVGEGASAYTKKFCFLHGTSYIAGWLRHYRILCDISAI